MSESDALRGGWWSVHLSHGGNLAELQKIEANLELLYITTGANITYHDIPFDEWTHG